MLHGCRLLYILHENRKHLRRHFAKYVETRFHTLNYELERILPKGGNKKVIGLMKNEFGGEIMTKFAAIKPKTYSSFIDDGGENKKVNVTKKCAIKRKFILEDYKHCLEATQVENEINKLEKINCRKYSEATIPHINSETGPPPPMINVVYKYLRQFLGTSLGVAILPISCKIE